MLLWNYTVSHLGKTDTSYQFSVSTNYNNIQCHIICMCLSISCTKSNSWSGSKSHPLKEHHANVYKINNNMLHATDTHLCPSTITESILQVCDNGMLHLKLFGFWILSIVWHSAENITLWEPSLFCSSRMKVGCTYSAANRHSKLLDELWSVQSSDWEYLVITNLNYTSFQLQVCSNDGLPGSYTMWYNKSIQMFFINVITSKLHYTM